jgi:glycosyltransferase involved in cell wall biosynthesis
VKLLFVNSAHPELWGGGEKWTITAAEWFQRRGAQARVVGRPASRLLKEAQARALATTDMRFGGDFDPVSIVRACKLLRTLRPDLVIVNFNKEGFHFGFAAAFLRIPVVARHGFPLLRRAPHHRLLVKRLYDKLIVNAESIREQYCELGYRVDEIEVIHNGVEPVAPQRAIWRERWNISSGEFLVVGAGRLEQQKRFDRFLRIAKLMREKIPQARFAIVGSGPFLKDLQQQSRALGLEKITHFPGFDSALAQNIAAADLLLLTSEAEGTPNVVLEAMAAGVPVLAMKCGSLPSILTAELAANLIAQADETGMAQRAVALLADPLQLKSNAELGHARIQTAFTLDASMLQFERVFRSLIKRGKS